MQRGAGWQKTPVWNTRTFTLTYAIVHRLCVRETAEIFLRGRNVPIITDDRLMEMSFGVFEGTANCFVATDSAIKTLFQKPEEYTVPVEGGESFDQLFARTGSS